MINTLTSGFSNPAEDYVTTRLTLDNVKNPIATYFFKYDGEKIFNINHNDILVVDRSVDPKLSDLVVATNDKFYIVKYKDINDLDYWGTIICVTK